MYLQQRKRIQAQRRNSLSMSKLPVQLSIQKVMLAWMLFRVKRTFRYLRGVLTISLRKSSRRLRKRRNRARILPMSLRQRDSMRMTPKEHRR